MALDQYGSYFYLYILFILLIPAIVLGIRGKLIRTYGIFFSAVMIILIMGWKCNESYNNFINGRLI